MVVGYFPIWNLNSGFTADKVDLSVFTHIGHFSVVPRGDGSIEIPDWGPFPDPQLIERAHSQGAKVFLVVGGDHAAATTGFSTMAASASTRSKFIQNLVSILDAQGYDGVELDWEFPSTSADRTNLTALVKDLRVAIGQQRSLSVAGPGSDWYGRWFDIPGLAPYLTWFSSMTYNFAASSWSPTSAHNSPLFGPASLDSARTYFLGRGLPADKLLLGVPFFGERFDSATGLNQTLTSTAGGAMEYPQIAALIGKGWTLHRDANAGQMPYLTRDGGSGLIVYDDVTSIAAKCSYVRDWGVAGVIVWRLGQDVVAGTQALAPALSPCR